MSSCKKRSHLKTFSVEYILGRGHDGLVNFTQKMEYTTMFDSPESKPTNIIDEGENSKSRHFFIHRAWSDTHYINLKTDIENIIFEFSYITKQGEIDKNKIQIKGKALHSMFVGSNLKKGPIFIYDKTPYKSLSINSSFVHQNMNSNFVTMTSQPFTQSQEGFCDCTFGGRMSQFSQCSESSNYENASTFSCQHNMFSQDNRQYQNFHHNTTYNTQNHKNTTSTSNKFNLRFVDI